MRNTAYIAALLAGTPALATEHKVVGADPTPRYEVCEGDTLILRKPMGRDLNADGTRNKSFSVWIDRQNGRGFAVDGATRLKQVGYVEGKGYVVAPLDAKPCAVAEPEPTPTPTPEPVAGWKPSVPFPLFGANLSGAEASANDAVRPSLYDVQQYVEYYGFRMIRYPFKAERLTAERIAELQEIASYLRGKGVPFILDRHDYQWRTPAEQIEFWTSLARQFPDDGSVILDIVNEPRGFDDPVVTNDWMQWIRDANQIIAGLRANGIKHPIAMEYPQWSAAFRFDKGEPSWKACESAGCAIDRGGGLNDPLNLTYVNAHRYWDKGSSGTSQSCDITWGETSGIDGFAAQLRKRGLKGIITEAAFGASFGVKDNCKGIGADAIADIKANADVLYGVTWWGGGRIWKESYLFKIEPKKAVRFSAPIPAYTKQLTGAE